MNEGLVGLVESFGRATLRSASARGVVPEAVLAEARRAAEEAGFEAFDLAHRGLFERSEHPLPPLVERSLVEIASLVAGRPLVIARHELMRFRAGGYSLRAEDHLWVGPRLGVGDPPLDVSLDLSTVATGEAEVVFTHAGVAYFTVPQRPGELGVAERGPSTGRFDRYLTHRVGSAVIVRLRALLVASR
jgi:hypothetical protein